MNFVIQVRGDVLTALVMESVTLDDIGDYKIHGKNPAGEDTCVAKLNVQGNLIPALNQSIMNITHSTSNCSYACFSFFVLRLMPPYYVFTELKKKSPPKEEPKPEPVEEKVEPEPEPAKEKSPDKPKEKSKSPEKPKEKSPEKPKEKSKSPEKPKEKSKSPEKPKEKSPEKPPEKPKEETSAPEFTEVYQDTVSISTIKLNLMHILYEIKILYYLCHYKCT